MPLRGVRWQNAWEDAIRRALGVNSESETLLFEGEDLYIADSCRLYFGTDGDVNFVFDGTDFTYTGALNITGDVDVTGQFDVNPAGDWGNLEGINQRYRLVWVAGQRGKPGLNADIQNAAEGTRMITDPDFEILGTNASSDDVTFYAEGGITFQTDGADGDEVILLPHLDANQTAWTQVTWGTDQEVRWECAIRTDANIDNAIIWAGLKLTNTEVTTTDDNQAFFRYENGVNSGKWQAISSIGGTDDAADSGVTVAINTVYHLVVEIDSSRVARFYINGTLVETSGALTDTTDLIPYIGVATDGAAEAKTLHIRGQAISRLAA